ncbi:hypothetical protein ACTXG6_43490 [Pseudonocardia sp. Cha107L01]|uniref:hypothetical protein n=1 Tax=Pseudonocardia sp. Cha107L01 TaxID=3457576 RepID=UPI00403E6AB0
MSRSSSRGSHRRRRLYPGESTEPVRTLPWDQRVAAAVGALFTPEVARRITEDDAFGALVYRLSSYCEQTDCRPVQALEQLDADDCDFAGRADNPAAFLARKVSEL